MVERFHRQLKAALKAQLNPNAWMDSLPLILLGIRTSLKEDLNSTAAEMVYGTTLRLPGEFFTPSSPTSLPDPSEYLNQLKAHFRTLSATSPRLTQGNSTFARGLVTATHVFVRHDTVRKPLQPPYDGPLPVVERTNKHYTVALNCRNDTISIDRLKPAHLDSEHSDTHTEQSPPTPHPTTFPHRPHHLIPLALVDVYTSPHISLVTCKTLGGSHVVNTLTLTQLYLIFVTMFTNLLFL